MAPVRGPSNGASARPAPAPFALAPRQPIAPGAAVEFEYAGRTALTVVSPLTGRNYRFDRPHARLTIDLRDLEYLRQIPNLRRAV